MYLSSVQNDNSVATHHESLVPLLNLGLGEACFLHQEVQVFLRQLLGFVPHSVFYISHFRIRPSITSCLLSSAYQQPVDLMPTHTQNLPSCGVALLSLN